MLKGLYVGRGEAPSLRACPRAHMFLRPFLSPHSSSPHQVLYKLSDSATLLNMFSGDACLIEGVGR